MNRSASYINEVLDLSKEAEGLYLLKLSAPNVNLTKKMIISR
jgi:hypothetical protein